MKNVLTVGPIEVRPSLVEGYGVFAKNHILRGEIIEECPIIFYDENYRGLENYTFQTAPQKLPYILPFGYGAVYNHANIPNAAWEFELEDRVMIITALRDIKKDEEILVTYGEKWFKQRNIVAETATSKRLKTVARILWRTAICIVALFALKWLFLTHKG